MEKYFLHNRLTAAEGKREELARLLTEASELVSTLPGSVLYAVSISKAEPDTVWVTEIWEGQEAHAASLADPRVRMLIMRGVPLLAAMPEKGQELTVLATGLQE